MPASWRRRPRPTRWWTARPTPPGSAIGIVEHSRFRIGRILVNGLVKTRPRIVRHRLKFEPGELFSYSKLLETQRRLYLTGLFRGVFIRPAPAADSDPETRLAEEEGPVEETPPAAEATGDQEPDLVLEPVGIPPDSAVRDVLVDVNEQKNGELGVALGYGSVEKVIGRAEVYQNNLFGTGRKLGFSGELSFINIRGELNYTEPWWFGSEWNGDGTLLMERRDEPGYDMDRWGGSVTLGRSFAEFGNFSVSYRQEDANFSNVEVAIEQIPRELTTTVQSLRSSLSFDNRDNMFNTLHGTFFLAESELGLFTTGGQAGFFRATGEYRTFIGLGFETTFATRVRLAWLTSPGGLAGIPLSERFYNGGPNTVRSFGYRELGPRDPNDHPIGGTFELTWNIAELRRPLHKMVGLALFADAGVLTRGLNNFDPGDIRYALGLGLRFNSPIGLFRLDQGFNPDPRAGEPVSTFHFSFGQAF